jgi:hypothetical protein
MSLWALIVRFAEEPRSAIMVAYRTVDCWGRHMAMVLCAVSVFCTAGPGYAADCEDVQLEFEANVGVLSAHLVRLERGVERGDRKASLQKLVSRSKVHLDHLIQSHAQLCRRTKVTRAVLRDLQNEFSELEARVSEEERTLIGGPVGAMSRMSGFFLGRNLDRQARRAEEAGIPAPESTRTLRVPKSSRPKSGALHAYGGFLDAWQDADDRFSRVYDLFRLPDGSEILP